MKAFIVRNSFFSILWEEILVIFGRTVNVLLITNPLLFPIWVLCAPKGMGSFLSEGNFWRTRVGSFMKRIAIWEATHILMNENKFSFIKNVGVDQVSPQFQVEFFNYLQKNGEDWEIRNFSPEAQKRIWKENNDVDVAKKILAGGYNLSEDEMINLIKNNNGFVLESYAQSRTLSTKVLKALYEYGEKRVFFNQISKNGIQPEIAEMVDPRDHEHLNSALREFSQVALVKATKEETLEDKQLFFKLAKSEKLCLRAQKELRLWQYRDMKTLGKSLYPEVILLKANPSKNQDWQEWVKLFIGYEDLSFPEWERSLLNNIQVRMFVMQNPALAVGKL